MGISMLALQAAGGIALFVFALRLIFGRLASSHPQDASPEGDLAVFPLAMPSIAAPGTFMAAIVLTDNHLSPTQVQAFTAVIAAGVMLFTLALMLLSTQVVRVIRPQGAEMLVRAMGLILAALSVELVMDAFGLSATFAI